MLTLGLALGGTIYSDDEMQKQCTACTVNDVTYGPYGRYTVERPPLLHMQLTSVFVSAGNLLSAPGTPCTLRKGKARCTVANLGFPHTHYMLSRNTGDILDQDGVHHARFFRAEKF